MGKTATCLQLLQILNTGRLFSISELAELLETSPRNVLNYKKELDILGVQCGFSIDPVFGPGGGYKLDGNCLLPTTKMTNEEKEAVLEGYNYLLSKKDFAKKPAFTKGFGKILMNVRMEEKDNNLIVVDKYQLSMSEEDIRIRYEFIESAIKEKRKIQLTYNSLKNGLKTYVLDPYTLFIYNNSWFFTAWCQDKCDVCYFKVNRIDTYEKLDNKFVVKRDYNAKKYFDEFGMANNGDYYHVVFTATGTRAVLCKERIYGRNQIIEDIGNDTIKVSLDMQNESAIISFALGCGTEIKVLEPQWLIDKIKDITLQMNKIYD